MLLLSDPLLAPCKSEQKEECAVCTFAVSKWQMMLTLCAPISDCGAVTNTKYIAINMHCQVFSENALTLTHITLQNGVKYLILLSFVPEKELVKMLRCDGSSRDSRFSCSLSQLGAVKEEKSVAAVRAEYNGQKLEVGRSSTSSYFRFSIFN